MAVLRSARVRVDETLLQSIVQTLGIYDHKTLVLLLKNGFHISQAFPWVQEQRVKHFGEFKHVKRFNTGLTQGTCARHVYIRSSSSQPWSSLLRDHPLFVCRQRWSDYHLVRIHLVAHPSHKPTKVRSSRGIGETRIGTCACCRHNRTSLFASRVSATVADACAPWRRDVLTQDEFGFPTNSQNQTNLSQHWALTCQCLLENGSGSGTSIPVDPQISVVSNENRRQEVSQFQACQCEIVLIPRSSLKRFL